MLISRPAGHDARHDALNAVAPFNGCGESALIHLILVRVVSEIKPLVSLQNLEVLVRVWIKTAVSVSI